jgi:hypothetical protein
MLTNDKKYKIESCYGCPRHIDFNDIQSGGHNYCNESGRFLRMEDYNIPYWCLLEDYNTDLGAKMEGDANADSG